MMPKRVNVSTLQTICQVSEVLTNKRRCFLGTTFGGVVVVKSDPMVHPKYRVYPVHKYSEMNFFPIESIVDFLSLVQQCKWELTGVR